MLQQVMTAPRHPVPGSAHSPAPQPGEVPGEDYEDRRAGRTSTSITGEHPSPSTPSPRGTRSLARLPPWARGSPGSLWARRHHSAPGGAASAGPPPRQVQPVRGAEGDSPDHGGGLHYSRWTPKVTLPAEGMSFDEGAMIEPCGGPRGAPGRGRGGKDICVLGGGPHRHFGGPGGQGLGPGR